MKKTTAFWRDKSVFITGASSGIGEALAQHLITQNAKIGLIARRENVLVELASQLTKEPNRVAWACADVVDAHGMAGAVQKLESELGPCDVMIANAGIYHKTDVADFDTETQNRVIATNTQGVINTVGAVMPGMIERQQGHLVAVASIAGMLGLPAAAAYSASKAAVITLFQSLRVDLHPYNIKATVAAPGYVDTPLITDAERATLKDLLSAEQAAQRICKVVERDRALDWFPWPTWLMCRLFSLAPSGLYRRLMSDIPAMEEPDHAASTRR